MKYNKKLLHAKNFMKEHFEEVAGVRIKNLGQFWSPSSLPNEVWVRIQKSDGQFMTVSLFLEGGTSIRVTRVTEILPGSTYSKPMKGTILYER